MKFLNFTVPNYILYIIGIIVLVSVVFLPVLFTVILPKLQNNSANSITTLGNSPLINLPTQYVNTTITPSTALSKQSIPPTTTEQLIVLQPIL